MVSSSDLVQNPSSDRVIVENYKKNAGKLYREFAKFFVSIAAFLASLAIVRCNAKWGREKKRLKFVIQRALVFLWYHVPGGFF